MIIEQYVKDKIQEIVVSCLNSSTTYANGSSSKLDLQDILFHFRHNPQRVRRIYTFVKAKSEKIKSKRKEDIEFTKKRDVLGQHIPGPLTPAFLQRDALLNAFSEPKEDDDEEPLSSYSIIKPEDYFTNLSSEKNYTFTETDKKVMPKIRNKDTSDVVTQKFQGIYRLANPLHNSTMITSSSLHSEDTPLLPTPLSSTNDIFNMSLDLSNNSLLSTSTPTPSQNNDQKNPLVPRKSSFLENMYLVRDEDRQRKIALENLENDLSYHEYRKYHSQKALIYDYAEDQKTFKEWVRLDRLTHHGKNVKFSSVVIDALAFIAWEIASLVTQTSLIVQRSMHLMPSTIREHHLGQATGIMTQKVRSRLSFVPDESARKLAQSFASVASAPRHPPIIPALFLKLSDDVNTFQKLFKINQRYNSSNK
eukprot:CAMPEP_0117422138 /NCGR_PEP_ID=MMETSP0758-20121206/3042_1 /TAXON_ID=63605 /ORGANISM="Percolomonas cosmopolitus, Strain AE-1 (ATCC 50343)" /LENGTH=419 /DNA_ID=CAMNT_0005204587 /DNA_START=236 /DNA_END=1493 /DNA_ORIENTATION=-